MENFEGSSSLAQGWSTKVGNRVINFKSIFVIVSSVFIAILLVVLYVFFQFRNSFKVVMESLPEILGLCSVMLLAAILALAAGYNNLLNLTVKYIIQDGYIKSISDRSSYAKSRDRSSLALDDMAFFKDIKRIVSMPAKRCIILYGAHRMVVFSPEGRHEEAVYTLSCLAAQANVEVNDTDSIFL